MFISDSSYYNLASFVILLQILLLYKLVEYKKKLDDKNIQLVQFHLDAKFLCKLLTESLKNSNSSKPNSSKLCNWFFDQIKQYYSLEEIILINYQDISNVEESDDRRKIIDFVRQNDNSISDKLQDCNLVQMSLENAQMQRNLHIARIGENNRPGSFIICVEDGSNILSQNEKISLENCINLLRTIM